MQMDSYFLGFAPFLHIRCGAGAFEEGHMLQAWNNAIKHFQGL